MTGDSFQGHTGVAVLRIHYQACYIRLGMLKVSDILEGKQVLSISHIHVHVHQAHLHVCVHQASVQMAIKSRSFRASCSTDRHLRLAI